MANNKYIRGLSGRGFRVKNNTGAWVTCKEGGNVQVDLEDVGTQDILSRERDNFVRVTGSGSTTAVLKPLTRRGIRLTPRSSTVTITEATPGVVSFTAHGLKTGDAITFATTGALPANLAVNTVYYVSSTTPTVNTFKVSATRALAIAGTNIATGGGAPSGVHTCYPVVKNVGQDSDVTVDLNDGRIKKFLKRNYGRYMMLDAAGNVVQDLVGIQDTQASFRVTDPVLTFAFTGGNNDVTFVPKIASGDLITIEFSDLGVDNVTTDILGTATAIEVSLAVTQNVQSSETIDPGGDADNDVLFTAKAAYPGTAGDAITVEYAEPVYPNNVSASFGVGVVGTDITFDLATDAGTAEVQSLTVDATGGDFTVTFGGDTTGALAFNISGANFTTAMEGLTSVEPGDVVVTGGPGDSGGTTPYVLTWNAGLGNVAQITANGAGLTGGGSTATPGTTTPGSAPVVTTTANAIVAGVAGSAPAAALVTAVAQGTGADAVGTVVQTALTGGVDYSIDSTATNVKDAIEAATPGAGDSVTVTVEGTGGGLVGVVAPTALGLDPEGLSRGEVVSTVDLTSSFNVGQLRRRFKAWVEG